MSKVSIELIESEGWIRAKVTVIDDNGDNATLTVAAINKLAASNDPQMLVYWKIFLEAHVERMFGPMVLASSDGVPEVTKES